MYTRFENIKYDIVYQNIPILLTTIYITWHIIYRAVALLYMISTVPFVRTHLKSVVKNIIYEICTYIGTIEGFQHNPFNHLTVGFVCFPSIQSIRLKSYTQRLHYNVAHII